MWHQAGVYSADCGIGENQLPWKVSGSKCASRDPAVTIPLVPTRRERGQRASPACLAV